MVANLPTAPSPPKGGGYNPPIPRGVYKTPLPKPKGGGCACVLHGGPSRPRTAHGPSLERTRGKGGGRGTGVGRTHPPASGAFGVWSPRLLAPRDWCTVRLRWRKIIPTPHWRCATLQPPSSHLENTPLGLHTPSPSERGGTTLTERGPLLSLFTVTTSKPSPPPET